MWIVPQHPHLSISRQCELAGMPRSTWYHVPVARESRENLRVMRLIDQVYLKPPYYGSPRITFHLRQLGERVNEKRVARLMRLMRLQAAVPGPHTSRPHPEHKVYPYLLRKLPIVRPNQVWATDITFVPLHDGYIYLVAVMDLYSRYVLSWELSAKLETAFCLVALEKAHLNDYADGLEAQVGLSRYFRFFNFERPHQSLDRRTPADVYFGRVSKHIIC